MTARGSAIRPRWGFGIIHVLTFGTSHDSTSERLSAVPWTTSCCGLRPTVQCPNGTPNKITAIYSSARSLPSLFPFTWRYAWGNPFTHRFQKRPSHFVRQRKMTIFAHAPKLLVRPCLSHFQNRAETWFSSDTSVTRFQASQMRLLQIVAAARRLDVNTPWCLS